VRKSSENPYTTERMADTAATDDIDRREERAVWLTERELDAFEREAESLRDRLIVNLGARCGLRISETVGLTVDDLGEEPVDGDLRDWATVRGKDTRADTDGKKQRRVWVPKDVWRDLRLQVQQENLEGDDPVPPSREEDTSRRPALLLMLFFF
jgi:Site-specific recombinase XerC